MVDTAVQNGINYFDTAWGYHGENSELVMGKALSLYNEHAYNGGGFIAPMALAALPEEKRPQACLQCQSCEQVCPQKIKISEVLADFSAKLG